MNKAPEYRVGIGASSILMIFIILCLTTLGVLSFASARANLALTSRRLVQVEAYYETTAQAQQLIAEIDAALLEARQDPENFETHLSELLGNDDRMKVSRDWRVSFSLPVGETQMLNVALQVNEPDQPQRYALTRHQVVNVADWNPDTSITLKTSQ